MSVMTRLRDAMNAHDIEAFVGCFHEDYESDQPAHPGRAFVGREQVRTNWSRIFGGVPDFTAALLREVAGTDEEWAEWRWTGTHSDGTALDIAGVTVFGIREDRIAWGHLYVEPVATTQEGIDDAVATMADPERADG